MRSLVELDIEAGITGVLDRFAVEQVVESLLSNAFYFGAGEAVTVRLRVDEQSLQLEVQDRGIGMLPDQQARILGRFERVIAQHPDFRLGTGLQVAHSLVTAMGGHIAVSSRVGKGSTFTVTLPLKSGPTVHDPHHLSVSALSG